METEMEKEDEEDTAEPPAKKRNQMALKEDGT